MPGHEAIRLLRHLPAPRPGRTSLRNAYEALKEAGHDPEVIKSYGLALLPDFLNQTQGRREVRELTGGNDMVPVAGDRRRRGHPGSKKIIEWAKAHPAGATSGA